MLGEDEFCFKEVVPSAGLDQIFSSALNSNGLHLNLTEDSKRTTFTILGNTDVEINWRFGGLNVSPTGREGYSVGASAEYEVTVDTYKNFTDKIVISLPATGQRTEIDVSYESGKEESRFLWGMLSQKWTAIILLSAVFVVASVLLILPLLNLLRPGIHSSPQSPPWRLAPSTPEKSPRGGSVTGDQSPRTPQPFVEYVKRTIDETPYYKRDGARRRFEPHNTY